MMYGFGAQVQDCYSQKASSLFSLNGRFFQPYIEGGLEEAIEVYRRACERVKLFRPDNINESIKFFCDMAEQAEVSQSNQKYFVLVVIADGIECFLEESIRSLIRSSTLPLSVIIVGTNTSLDKLDGHMNPGLAADMHYNPTWQTISLGRYANNESLISEECLELVEDNILTYYRRNGIKPNGQDPDERPKSDVKEFFSVRMNQFIRGILGDNTDHGEWKKHREFIRRIGLFEENPRIIHKFIDDASYENPLRVYITEKKKE